MLSDSDFFSPFVLQLGTRMAAWVISLLFQVSGLSILFSASPELARKSSFVEAVPKVAKKYVLFPNRLSFSFKIDFLKFSFLKALKSFLLILFSLQNSGLK